MQLIFAGICFIGFIAILVFVKYLDLNGLLTAAIIIPLLLLMVYSLARIQTEKPKAEKDTNK
jgi:energy-converting hydrogenase Eha subunit C